MSDDHGDDEGPFRPLSDAERRKAERAAPADKGQPIQPIIPIPSGVGDPDWGRLRPKGAKGAPVAWWIYPTADGAGAFLVARWNPEEPNGRKVVRPVTWCRLPDGRECWAFKAMPEPRPLYNLPDILESDSEVVVVEGEKCVDAAARVFPDRVVTTWSGGTNAWAETDWQPLAGRTVLLVADGDEPGRITMRALAGRLHSLGCAVRLLLPIGDAGRDIADGVEAKGLEGCRNLVEQHAKPYKPKTADASDTGEASDASDKSEAAGTPATGETADTDGTPDDTNWMEELVKRTKTDPGAPFEPEILAKMRDLQSTDIANWIRLRARFRKEAKVSVLALDKVLKRKGEGLSRSTLRGQVLQWLDDEPWLNEIDGAALLDEMTALIMRYVYMTEAQADTVALWILYSWLHGQWDISAFLGITSATKRCGKSLLLEVIEELALRPLNLGGQITSPALFRTIEEYRPTCLLDEADTYLRDDHGLRGLINSSQRRSGAGTVRMVKLGDDFVTAFFRAFCPKVIAGIGNLTDTIRDRSILVELVRRPASGPETQYWGDRDRAETKAIRRKIARWTRDHAATLYRLRRDVPFPPGLHDRARDAWAPLLSIAERAGGGWSGQTGRAWRACETITATTKDETDIAEMLLTDMRQVFHQAGDPRHLPTGKSEAAYDPYSPAILPALIAMEGRPWSEHSRRRPLSTRGLASLLGRFKIKSGTIRPQSGPTAKGYKREAFEPVWERYDIRDPEDRPDPSA